MNMSGTTGHNGVTTMGITNPAEFYDQVAAEYDQGFSEPIYKAEEMAVLELVKRDLRGRILDIGCGTGLFLEYENPEEYVGMDISPGMIAKAKERYPDREFHVADMQEFVESLPDNSIDTVFSMFGALSYSLKPDQFVAQCRRVVRPGGKVILMPITERTGKGIDLSNTTANNNNVPKICYSSNMLDTLFREGNLKDVRVTGLNYFGDQMAERAKKMDQAYDAEQLRAFLLNESKTIGLPIEFARHAIVRGEK